jgi:hypothetical protein
LKVAPDDVEVVEEALVLAQAQALGQEEVVEEAALGVGGEVLERLEVDLAARVGGAPDGRVVDAGDVGGEVDLSLRGHATTSFGVAVLRVSCPASPWLSLRAAV